MTRRLVLICSLMIAALFVAACAPAEEAPDADAPAATEAEGDAPEDMEAGEEAPADADAAPEVEIPEGMPETDGMAVVNFVTEDNDYTTWDTWPEDEWNNFEQFLVSGEPHGNVVRIFVNETGLEAANNYDGSLPAGTMIVKENYPNQDTENPGDLAALTIMYKVPGFNPDANDWYWVKTKDGASAIDKEGAVAGCIGCHSQSGHHDYVLRYGFGEEPAVTSLGGGDGS